MTDHLRTWTPIPLATSRYECPCGATGRCNMSGVIVAQKTDRPVNWEATPLGHLAERKRGAP